KYQPIVNLAEDDKQYYEICLTLKDQTEDEITGEGLLAAFEALGDNTELDRWIIVEATKQAVQNCKAGGQTRLIINLSSNVFKDKGLTPWLNVALKAAELPADSLVFQFRAESCAKSLKPAIGFATKLRATGANIALRSSNPVSYDKNALTQLKPLLTKLNVDIQNSENLSAAIQTVQEAGSKAIVTGVESAATLATLWQLKPDYVQGSYIHSPTSSMDYDFGDG
ncbi:MAG: EAL domain-containing protein (putative c-di-GMP-specific phosphodiesterase class I), partial [Bermanella sp.]